MRVVELRERFLRRKSFLVKDLASGAIPPCYSGIIPLTLHLVLFSPHLVFFCRHPAALSPWDNDSNSLTSIETLLVLSGLDFLEFPGASVFHFVSKLSVLLISVLFVQGIVDCGPNCACPLGAHISKLPGSHVFFLNFDFPPVLSCAFVFSKAKLMSLEWAKFLFSL